MKFVKNVAHSVRESLNHPLRITVYCFIFFVLTLSLNGVPLRLWGLYRDLDRYRGEMKQAQIDIGVLGEKLSQASDPLYIEKQARDRLDLVGENDLIFVFPTQ